MVAVARKLSVLLHHLWITGELYEPLYNVHGSGSQAAYAPQRNDDLSQAATTKKKDKEVVMSLTR